jgi:hypothetical protein
LMGLNFSIINSTYCMKKNIHVVNLSWHVGFVFIPTVWLLEVILSGGDTTQRADDSEKCAKQHLLIQQLQGTNQKFTFQRSSKTSSAHIHSSSPSSYTTLKLSPFCSVTVPV